MTRLRSAWRPTDRAARPAGMLIRHPGEQAGTRFRPPGTHHRGAALATVAKNTGRCHLAAHSLAFVPLRPCVLASLRPCVLASLRPCVLALRRADGPAWSRPPGAERSLTGHG